MSMLSDKFKMMIKKGFKFSPRGFTLIELLIVVAIISILVSIGSVSFRRIQQQGRNTQRQSNLQEVASALEQYYGDNNTYPENDNDGKIKCGGSAILWGSGIFCSSPNTYLSPLPIDPDGSQYYYDAQGVSGPACDNSATPCVRFVISAKYEGTPPTPDCTVEGGYDICVDNP